MQFPTLKMAHLNWLGNNALFSEFIYFINYIPHICRKSDGGGITKWNNFMVVNYIPLALLAFFWSSGVCVCGVRVEFVEASSLANLVSVKCAIK